MSVQDREMPERVVMASGWHSDTWHPPEDPEADEPEPLCDTHSSHGWRWRSRESATFKRLCRKCEQALDE